MTRKEITGERDLRFSGWVREKLPDSSTGFRVTDIDFVLANVQTKRFMILEIKTRNSEIRPWQKSLLSVVNRSIRAGIGSIQQGPFNKWTYLGMHLIVFENTYFDDGKVYLNDILITEDELCLFLSMRGPLSI